MRIATSHQDDPDRGAAESVPDVNSGNAGTGLPLSTLLSQVLVAFTIEFDNEFERQMPHRTTRYGPSAIGDGPWLVSQVMWSNFMRFVGEGGVTVGELQRLARITKGAMHTSLAGMTRWGYVVVEPDPADSRPNPPRTDWIVRPTPAGRKSQEIWRPLSGEIEERWRARYGRDKIDELRAALLALESRIDAERPHYLPTTAEMPDYFPLLRYGLFTELPSQGARGATAHSPATAPSLDLSALLSRILLAFTIEFERESKVSLAISANILRLLGEAAVPLRDLPRLSCVSKEALNVSIGLLERGGYVLVEPAASRGKVVLLTSKGQEAQKVYRKLPVMIEQRWQSRFGTDMIGNLRTSLEALVDTPDGEPSLLSRAVVPPPGGWRTLVRTPDGLPHHPLVLHRGGFPDGS